MVSFVSKPVKLNGWKLKATAPKGTDIPDEIYGVENWKKKLASKE